MKLQITDKMPKLSESLKRLLKDIATQCPIARTLYAALTTPHEVTVQSPIYRADRSTWRRLRGRNFAYCIFNPSPVGDYFSFREKDNMVSYCPAGREQKFTPDDKWARDGRVEMKPAKFLRALLHPRLARRYKDHQFAAFSEKFRAAEASSKVSFEFVSFEAGYDSENHKADSPAECNSCMRDENVGPFYRAYGAQCLVAKNKDGLFFGRAIVWPAVRGIVTGKSVPFMDRVYAESPEVAELFFQHAAANGIYRKESQNSTNRSGYISPSGVPGSARHMHIDLSPEVSSTGHVEFFPYCDTFMWMNPDSEELNNYGEDGDNELDNTDGEMTRNEGIMCEDGIRRPIEDCVEVDGSWYSQNDDDIVCCDDGDYRMRDDCFCCERSGNYYPNSEGYSVQLSRNNTITIHRDYVDTLE